MIGKIVTGKSFRGCLSYLHEGRLQATRELQELEAERKQAKVIAFNQCFGEKKELIRQFNEVRQLNRKLAKPVFHATISFAHADSRKLGDQDKADIAAELAKTFRFEDNQYVVIAHGDTRHEHLHVVANRIGYDGKTASDSNSYKRMAEFCRKMERANGLTQVPSPNRFLTRQERLQQAQAPRIDNRKEKLKQQLKCALQACTSVKEVARYMQRQGYQVELGRGIAFTDQQHVRFKGSQVGFALADIEKKLKQKSQPQSWQQKLQPEPKRKPWEQDPEINQTRGFKR
jgi:hypothetical protein